MNRMLFKTLRDDEDSEKESSILSLTATIGRVNDEKSQLGITAICFFGTILDGETEFTAHLMF